MLLADGWHMATHVAALGYECRLPLSRRFASHRVRVWDGKVQTLAGFTSAVALGLVAAAMIVESISRLVCLVHPFGASFPSPW